MECKKNGRRRVVVVGKVEGHQWNAGTARPNKSGVEIPASITMLDAFIPATIRKPERDKGEEYTSKRRTSRSTCTQMGG
jgi:hypothetical protein